MFERSFVFIVRMLAEQKRLAKERAREQRQLVSYTVTVGYACQKLCETIVTVDGEICLITCTVRRLVLIRSPTSVTKNFKKRSVTWILTFLVKMVQQYLSSVAKQ